MCILFEHLYNGTMLCCWCSLYTAFHCLAIFSFFTNLPEGIDLGLLLGVIEVIIRWNVWNWVVIETHINDKIIAAVIMKLAITMVNRENNRYCDSAQLLWFEMVNTGIDYYLEQYVFLVHIKIRIYFVWIDVHCYKCSQWWTVNYISCTESRWSWDICL